MRKLKLFLVTSLFFFLFISISQARASWWNSSYLYRRVTQNTTNNQLIFPFVDEDPDSDGSLSTYYGQNGSIYYNNDSDFAFANSSSQRCGFSTIVNGAKNQIDKCPYKPDGLVSYWTLDNDNAWDPISGNNGTLNGGVTTGATGKVKNAYDFDGSDDYVQLPSHFASIYNANAFTTSAWIKTSVSGGSSIVGNNWGGVQLLLEDGEDIATIRVKIGSTGPDKAESTTVVADGSWYMVTATFDGSDLKMYVNGSLEDTYTESGILNEITDNFRIGREDGGDFPFDGTIDDVRIYNRSLSASEIQALYNATKPTVGHDPTFGAEETLSQAPNTALQSPANDTTASNPVTFNYLPKCYSPNGCSQAELFFNMTENITYSNVTDTETEWNQGGFTNTTTDGSGNLVLSGGSTDIGEEDDGDVAEWSGETSYIRAVSSPTYSSSYAIEMYTDGNERSVTKPIPSYSNFEEYSFWIQMPNDANNEFNMWDGGYGGTQVFGLYFRSREGIYWSAESGRTAGVEIVSNANTNQDTWYHIEYKNIDWSANTLDIYVDGVNKGTYSFINAGGKPDTMYLDTNMGWATDPTFQLDVVQGIQPLSKHGNYTSKTFNAGNPAYWKFSSITSTVPTNTDYNISYAENSSGTWNYYDTFPTNAYSQYFKYNISMSGNTTETPSIDKVNITHDKPEETWKSRKTNQSAIVNNTENGIQYDFSNFSLPQVFKWNIKLTDGVGQVAWGDNWTVTVTTAITEFLRKSPQQLTSSYASPSRVSALQKAVDRIQSLSLTERFVGLGRKSFNRVLTNSFSKFGVFISKVKSQGITLLSSISTLSRKFATATQQVTVNEISSILVRVRNIFTQRITPTPLVSTILEKISTSIQGISPKSVVTSLVGIRKTLTQSVLAEKASTILVGVKKGFYQEIRVGLTKRAQILVHKFKSQGVTIFSSISTLSRKFATTFHQIKIKQSVIRRVIGIFRREAMSPITVSKVSSVLVRIKKVLAQGIPVNLFSKVRVLIGRVRVQRVNLNSISSYLVSTSREFTQKIVFTPTVSTIAKKFATASQQINIRSISSYLVSVSKKFAEKITLSPIVSTISQKFAIVSQQVSLKHFSSYLVRIKKTLTQPIFIKRAVTTLMKAKQVFSQGIKLYRSTLIEVFIKQANHQRIFMKDLSSRVISVGKSFVQKVPINLFNKIKISLSRIGAQEISLGSFSSYLLSISKKFTQKVVTRGYSGYIVSVSRLFPQLISPQTISTYLVSVPKKSLQGIKAFHLMSVIAKKFTTSFQRMDVNSLSKVLVRIIRTSTQRVPVNTLSFRQFIKVIKSAQTIMVNQYQKALFLFKHLSQAEIISIHSFLRGVGVPKFFYQGVSIDQINQRVTEVVIKVSQKIRIKQLVEGWLTATQKIGKITTAVMLKQPHIAYNPETKQLIFLVNNQKKAQISPTSMALWLIPILLIIIGAIYLYKRVR